MSKLEIPSGYHPLLDELTTEKAIRKIKELFQGKLAFELKLQRVTAPLCVLAGTGLNDDLNGVEHAVGFQVKDADGAKVEVVHSLAKWKRVKLAKLQTPPDHGIYTDMNAIRADEELDNLHSMYVDQWDWEKVITRETRTLDTLKETVKSIYYAMRRTERALSEDYPVLKPFLPKEITFVHSEDAEAEFPTLTPKQREDRLAERYGAIFLIGIGGKLPISGEIHDGRAPDYDDWSSPSDGTHHGLNGDIIVWNPVLKHSFEVSSMGIRVDKEALLRQLKIRQCEERLQLKFHRDLVEGRLPLSLGGGIGQSRLCMLFLQKAHIGEIQAAIWPQAMIDTCRENSIPLL